jgi:hypothetical protein
MTQIANARPDSKPPPAKLPVIVNQFFCNRRGEIVRVTIDQFEGVTVLDLRKHYTGSDGISRPTRKGLTVTIKRLPDLAKAVNEAVAKARELGLIEGQP